MGELGCVNLHIKKPPKKLVSGGLAGFTLGVVMQYTKQY